MPYDYLGGSQTINAPATGYTKNPAGKFLTWGRRNRARKEATMGQPTTGLTRLLGKTKGEAQGLTRLILGGMVGGPGELGPAGNFGVDRLEKMFRLGKQPPVKPIYKRPPPTESIEDIAKRKFMEHLNSGKGITSDQTSSLFKAVEKEHPWYASGSARAVERSRPLRTMRQQGPLRENDSLLNYRPDIERTVQQTGPLIRNDQLQRPFYTNEGPGRSTPSPSYKRPRTGWYQDLMENFLYPQQKGRPFNTRNN